MNLTEGVENLEKQIDKTVKQIGEILKPSKKKKELFDTDLQIRNVY